MDYGVFNALWIIKQQVWDRVGANNKGRSGHWKQTFFWGGGPSVLTGGLEICVGIVSRLFQVKHFYSFHINPIESIHLQRLYMRINCVLFLSISWIIGSVVKVLLRSILWQLRNILLLTYVAFSRYQLRAYNVQIHMWYAYSINRTDISLFLEQEWQGPFRIGHVTHKTNPYIHLSRTNFQWLKNGMTSGVMQKAKAKSQYYIYITQSVTPM